MNSATAGAIRLEPFGRWISGGEPGEPRGPAAPIVRTPGHQRKLVLLAQASANSSPAPAPGVVGLSRRLVAVDDRAGDDGGDQKQRMRS
jgi:hypothetical protein